MGHKEGHHTGIDETVAMIGAEAAGAANDSVSTDNAGNIGGATTQATYISPAVVIPGPSVRVSITVSGTDSTVDDPVTAQIIRDPTSTTGAPGGTAIGALPTAGSGHVSGHFAITTTWVDTVVPGSSHTYGATASGVGNILLNATKTSVTIEPL